MANFDVFQDCLARESNDHSRHFSDLAFVDRETEKVAEPEPLKRVKVLSPFQVSHEGIRYFPGEVAEVPESLADHWIRSQWVVSDEVRHDVEPARKRGRRST